MLYKANFRNVTFKRTKEMRKACANMKLKLATKPVLFFPNFGTLFIAEAGALSITVGAVLSQKQADGNVHLIQFALSKNKSYEKKYSTREQETIAVVFALQNFRLQLLSSEPLVLISSQHMIQYSLKEKDLHGELERWTVSSS